MYPFNAYRKSYITVCLAVAVIYASVAGFGQPVVFRLVDGILYGVLLFSTGIVLWNIFRYAMPVHYKLSYRIAFSLVLASVTVALVTGIETFAAFLCFSSSFEAFITTIPVRVFITFLLGIMYYLYYLLFHYLQAEKYDTTNQTVIPANQIVDRITVRSGQKIRIIPVDSILYIKADGDYISIRTAEGSWLKEQTMKYTEDRLPVSNFVRIHRSYIVNIHRISRIERYGEKQQVVLSNNEKIKISAARYQALKQILGI